MSKNVVREQTAAQRVLEYTPKKFDIGVPDPALEFQEIKRQRENDFRMSEVLRVQTGLNKIEAQESHVLFFGFKLGIFGDTAEVFDHAVQF